LNEEQQMKAFLQRVSDACQYFTQRGGAFFDDDLLHSQVAKKEGWVLLGEPTISSRSAVREVMLIRVERLEPAGEDALKKLGGTPVNAGSESVSMLDFLDRITAEGGNFSSQMERDKSFRSDISNYWRALGLRWIEPLGSPQKNTRGPGCAHSRISIKALTAAGMAARARLTSTLK
jgi:hypothetical protein